LTFLFEFFYNFRNKIFSSTRIDEAVVRRPFLQGQGEVDGNPRAMRDLPPGWEEPSFACKCNF
jgi:hypothetical protein